MIRYVPSIHHFKPNKNFIHPVEGIVIHAMLAEVNGMPAPEFLAKYGLSAHAFIHMDGTVQLGQPLDKIGYHAGKSAHDRLGSGLNKNTIGIECLVPMNSVDPKDPFGSFLSIINNEQWMTTAGLAACVDFVDMAVKRYPGIRLGNIVKHSDVSNELVRPDPKSDPGKMFPWNSFLSKVSVQVYGNLE